MNTEQAPPKGEIGATLSGDVTDREYRLTSKAPG
jgi:hypothetical protein